MGVCFLDNILFDNRFLEPKELKYIKDCKLAGSTEIKKPIIDTKGLSKTTLNIKYNIKSYEKTILNIPFLVKAFEKKKLSVFFNIEGLSDNAIFIIRKNFND